MNSRFGNVNLPDPATLNRLVNECLERLLIVVQQQKITELEADINEKT